jgi:hypothetical protein
MSCSSSWMWCTKSVPYFAAVELFSSIFKMIKPGMPIVLFHSGMNGMSRISCICHSTFTECCICYTCYTMCLNTTLLHPFYGVWPFRCIESMRNDLVVTGTLMVCWKIPVLRAAIGSTPTLFAGWCNLACK